jgi:WD40-like Beta Propeller Repeat
MELVMLRLKSTLFPAVLAFVMLNCGGSDGSPNGNEPTANSIARTGTLTYVHINKLLAVNMTNGSTKTLADLVTVGSSRSYAGATVGPAQEFVLSYNTDAPLSNTAWVTILKPDGSQEADIRLRYMLNGPPVISPDGTKIAVDASTYPGSLPTRKYLQVMSRSGQALYFYADYRYPQWMPDGRLLMQGANGLYVAGTDINIAPVLIPNSNNIANHSISPDGKQIAFARRARAGAPLHIYIMNIDGSGTRQVTTSADGGQTNVQFSPDGKNLMVTTSGCISVFDSYPYVTGQVDEDLIHVIPASSSMVDLLQSRRLAGTALQREDGLGRCTAGTLSWR